MKKIATLLLVIISSIVISSAQNGSQSGRGKQWVQLQSQKIAYMSSNLELTPAESEKFWPLYNQYWEEKIKISHQRRALYLKIEKELATQADLDALIKLSADETQLLTRYTGEITRAISADKAAKAIIWEEKFKSTLLQMTQHRTMNGGSGAYKK